MLHHLLHSALGVAVVASAKVGGILLCKCLSRAAAFGVGSVVFEDAAGGEDCAVDTFEIAAICQVEGADDVGADCGLFVGLAPLWMLSASVCSVEGGRSGAYIDIRTSGDTGTVEDVGWLLLVEKGEDLFTVLHADGGLLDILALGF